MDDVLVALNLYRVAQREAAPLRQLLMAQEPTRLAAYLKACLWDLTQERIESFCVLDQVGCVYLIKFKLDWDPVLPFIPLPLIHSEHRSEYGKAMRGLLAQLLEVAQESGQLATDQQLAAISGLVQQLTPMISWAGEPDPEAWMFWYAQLRLTASDPGRLS